MKRRFELSEEQEREFRTLMKEMEDKMLKHKSASRERFEIYQQFSPRIREFVPEDLKDVYDAGRRRIERRYRRAINRAASESNG